MNPFALINFIVSIYVLSLGFFAWRFNPKSRNNQLFFFLTISTFDWLFFYGFVLSSSGGPNALELARIGHVGGIFAPVLCQLFIFSMTEPSATRLDRLIRTLGIPAAGLATYCLFAFPERYLVSISNHDWGHYPAGGILMAVYAVWTGFLVADCVVMLARSLGRASTAFNEDERQRLKYLGLAMTIFCAAAIEYLPKFGIPIYPFGAVCVAFFATITTYAILRHKLLDIDIVLRRSFVYSALVFFMTLIYLGAIITGEFVFRSFFRYGSLLIALIASTLIALIFNPLRSRLHDFIDKRFYKLDAEIILEENRKLKNVVLKQDQMKAVATLAAGMAHEIKNPLTSIKTFAEFLPDRYNDPEFRDKFKRIVSDEVDRVNNIVKQILEFSKPTPPDLKRVNLSELIDETLAVLENNFVKIQATVSKTYTANLEILADRTQLKQVLVNLILNSLQAMKPQGKIAISSVLQGTWVQVTIEDTGCGISKNEIDHIFDPFYTTKDSGTGLGLSIVRGIMEEHGGKIEVSSVLGTGTQMKLYFPKKF